MTEVETPIPPKIIREVENPEFPWRDKSLLRHLRRELDMSLHEMADVFGCAQTTVGNHCRNHGIRPIPKPAYFYMTYYGYESWQDACKGEKVSLHIHRLQAVAEWGFEAVAGNDVHHKNGIKWDNRIENLEIMDPGEHMELHKSEYSKEEQTEIAEKYENTDASSRNLGKKYGITGVTVLRYHRIAKEEGRI